MDTKVKIYIITGLMAIVPSVWGFFLLVSPI